MTLNQIRIYTYPKSERMSNEAEKCWLIQSGSELAGPYSLAQLRALARSGRIARSTLIRDLHSSGWLVAGQLPELFQQALPTIRAADQTKPIRQQTTPARPASPMTLASPDRVSMLPPAPSGFAEKKDFASSQRAIIVAAAAGAVGSAGVVMLLFFSLQRTTTDRPGPAAEVDVVTTGPVTTASTANVDAKTSAAPSQSVVYSTEDLVSRTQQSVAAVITNQGSGSGFVVARHVLATNYHVIADSPSSAIAVVFPDGEVSKRGPFQAMIIAEQPDRDLALLRIEAEIPALEVYPNYQFRRGQDIVIIGTPGLFRGKGILPNAVTRGVLSSQAELDGFKHFQLSLAVNSGNSGGPVLGMDGRVIGVVVSKSLSEESIGFCIPATDLESLIKSHENSSFLPTAKTALLHDARYVIRAIVDQIFIRDENMAKYISLSETDPSADGFMKDLKKFFQNAPFELFKSYASELGRIALDPQLPVDVRRAIIDIRRRQIAIERLLQSPTGNVRDFVNQLGLLEKGLLAQLEYLNSVLEIGRPELLTK